MPWFIKIPNKEHRTDKDIISDHFTKPNEFLAERREEKNKNQQQRTEQNHKKQKSKAQSKLKIHVEKSERKKRVSFFRFLPARFRFVLYAYGESVWSKRSPNDVRMLLLLPSNHALNVMDLALLTFRCLCAR